jgi:hypothetical protein
MLVWYVSHIEDVWNREREKILSDSLSYLAHGGYSGCTKARIRDFWVSKLIFPRKNEYGVELCNFINCLNTDFT